MDDRELLSEYVANGSQAAFGELVSRHIDAVYAAARRQVRDPHLAEDVAQAVFIILARKAKSFGPGVIVAGWLINTAYFASMDALKSEGRRKRHEHEAAEMAPLFHAPPETPGFSDIAPHLDAAMQKLNHKDRGAVALRFLEGKSLREVGTALGISEEAARKRVSRAVTKLRKHLVRRGIGPASVASVAALIVVLEAGATADAAPLGLAHTVTSAATTMKMSLAGATIAKGAMSSMAWAKAKFAATAAALLIVTGGGAVAVQQVVANRAAASVRATAGNPFRQTIGNVTVELLGVRTAGTNWWKPDGSPLAQSPYFRASNTPTPPPGSRVYELAATWSAPVSATAGNDPVSWSVSSGNAFGGAALASDGKRMKDVHMLSVILPEDTKTLNVAFHVAAGPWTTAAEWDGKGKQLDTQGSNVKLRILLEGNRTRVISADGITDRAARLTVFLNGGKTATASMGQSPQWPRVIETRVDVPAAISRIKFETSSFQHLICTNASLDPLERTTVKWKSGGAWLPGDRSFESVDAGGDALTTASLLADFPVDNAIIPGISVGLIRIGMTDAELEAAVGKPEWIPGKSSATVRHFPSRGFSVTLSGGSGGDTTPRRVTSVVCGGDTATPAARKLVDAFTLKTPDGIGMGSSQADIERTLGKPDDTGRPDPNDNWRSIKYLDKGIEFALRDGKVVWLAVRAPRK